MAAVSPAGPDPMMMTFRTSASDTSLQIDRGRYIEPGGGSDYSVWGARQRSAGAADAFLMTNHPMIVNGTPRIR